MQSSNVIGAKTWPCTLLLFTWKWITSVLSFILLKKNGNLFNPWGLVFPRSPFFLRSWVPVRVRFFDDAQNDEQFHKLQNRVHTLKLWLLSGNRYTCSIPFSNNWIASYVRKKEFFKKESKKAPVCWIKMRKRNWHMMKSWHLKIC